MPTCTHALSVICVLLTTVAVVVAFLTPNWREDQRLSMAYGLWLRCATNDWRNCQWYFDNNFMLEKTFPIWLKATQGLFTCAVATSIVTLVIALCSICCKCYNCNQYHATAAFSNFTFVLLAVSMCLYGAKAHLDWDVSIDPNGWSVFGWSFWLGVAATGMSLISTLLYFCLGRRDRYRI